MVQDPYKVLGVPENATENEIKAAYRKKAKEYHPDLHPNDPVAEKKMGEINEAYDMLINPEKYAQRRQQQEQSRPGGSSQGGQGRPGGSYQGPGGWASDFGGFDFGDIFGFGGFYGRGASAGPQAQAGDSMELRRAIDAINQGQYAKAVQMLNTIVSTGRNGRWYYLSALANHGAGNEVLALEQIRRAVQMEPNNGQYHRVLQQFQQAGQTYRQSSQGFHMDPSGMQRLCFGLCAAQLFCRFCGM